MDRAMYNVITLSRLIISPGALDFEMGKNSRKLIFFRKVDSLESKTDDSLSFSMKAFFNSRWRPAAISDLWDS